MFTRNASKNHCGGWRQRLAATLLPLLCGGATPRRLAWALTVGAVLGLMPLLWGTSLLCLAAALLFRLNPAVVQLGNFGVYPLQIVLFLPYVHLGMHWFGGSAGSAAARISWQLAASDPTGVLCRLIAANGAALGVWGVTAAVLTPLFYAISVRLIETLPLTPFERPSSKEPLLPNDSHHGFFRSGSKSEKSNAENKPY